MAIRSSSVAEIGMHKGGRGERWWSLALAVLVPLCWVAFAGQNLTAQGLHFDEVQHACASFAVVGRSPEMFVAETWGTLPVFGLPYNGTLRPLSFGLAMRLLERPFSPWFWRATSLVTAGLGLLLFGLLCRRALGASALCAALALSALDVSILLQGRHDWGPFSMLFLLRMVWLALWIRWEDRVIERPLLAATLSALVGVMTYEKLSAIALIPGHCLMLIGGARRPGKRVVAASALGLAIGMAPVLVVNAISLIGSGQTAIDRFMAPASTVSPLTRLAELGQIFDISVDPAFRQSILGEGAPAWAPPLESLLVLLALAFTLWAERRSNESGSRRLLLALAGAGAALLLLPAATSAHHWTLLLPMLPLALVLAWRRLPAQTRGRRLGAALLGVWVVFRLLAVGDLGRALATGAASAQWSPALTTAARLAVSEADRTFVMVGTWGLATQIYCLANGRPGFVREMWWEYPGPKELKSLLPRDGRDIVVLDFDPNVYGKSSSAPRILRAMRRDPDWREVANSPGWEQVRPIVAWRFAPVKRKKPQL